MSQPTNPSPNNTLKPADALPNPTLAQKVEIDSHPPSAATKQKQPRCRTQSYKDTLRINRGLLDDQLPPRFSPFPETWLINSIADTHLLSLF